MTDTIGFVGLGAMGLPMASNLATAGFEVRGFDIADAARDAFAAAGGSAAATAAEAAAGADILVLMVVNAAQADTVLFDAGAAEALAPDGVVVLMSTCPPGAVAALAQRVDATGRRFVDAPVSGGVAGAKAASLTVMAAAPADALARVRPMLEAVGRRIFVMGERPGQGAAMKSINQLLCGVHIAAAAEAMAFARGVGVDVAQALEIVSGSAAASWMLSDRGPRMLEDSPSVTSAIDIFVKDLGIVLDAGREARAALPLAAAAQQMFLATSGRGLGAADDSQVVRTYELMSAPPRD